MGADSKIEWTDHTFNPWTGCTKISPACTNCYAEAWAKRSGLVQWGNDAERRRTSKTYWRQPLKWDRAAQKAGERRRVFCASLADVFEDREELIVWRDNLYDLIRATLNLDWLLLTKRPENLRRMLPVNWLTEPQPNVWIGTTVENQEYADKRIPELLKIPARVRFLSVEPLLGSINLRDSEFGIFDLDWLDKLQWVIVGGESGPHARPMDLEWARSIRDQCSAAGVAFFGKQWDKKKPLPDDLMVRQFPEAV